MEVRRLWELINSLWKGTAEVSRQECGIEQQLNEARLGVDTLLEG